MDCRNLPVIASAGTGVICLGAGMLIGKRFKGQILKQAVEVESWDVVPCKLRLTEYALPKKNAWSTSRTWRLNRLLA